MSTASEVYDTALDAAREALTTPLTTETLAQLLAATYLTGAASAATTVTELSAEQAQHFTTELARLANHFADE